MSINPKHRYLIKRHPDGAYVGSTDDLGEPLPSGFTKVDTKGEDDLGTVNGSYGIPDFIRAQNEGRCP